MLIHTDLLNFTSLLFDSVWDVKRIPSEASVLLVKISANAVSVLRFRYWIRCFLEARMVLGVMSRLKPVIMSELLSSCQ